MPGAYAWCVCLVPMSGAYVWCLCLVRIPGAYAWCLCLLRILCCVRLTRMVLLTPLAYAGRLQARCSLYAGLPLAFRVRISANVSSGSPASEISARDLCRISLPDLSAGSLCRISSPDTLPDVSPVDLWRKLPKSATARSRPITRSASSSGLPLVMYVRVGPSIQRRKMLHGRAREQRVSLRRGVRDSAGNRWAAQSRATWQA
jgi:hypothetical protein